MRGVIAYRQDLLGSRLLNFLHAYQATRAIGVPLFVLWPDETIYFDGSYRFSDLFDVSRLDGVELIRSYEPAEVARAVGVEAAALDTLPHLKDVLIEKDGVPILQADLCWHNSTQPLGPMRRVSRKEDIAALFWSLPLQQDVATALEQASRINTSNYLAIHMRRGKDIISATWDEGDYQRVTGIFALKDADQERLSLLLKGFISKYVPLATMRRMALEVQRAEQLDGIVLFSNDPEDRQALKSSLGEAVFDVHEILDRQHHLTMLQRTFCELALMSKARTILGCVSNFSRSAVQLGGAKILYGHLFLTAEELLPDLLGYLDAADIPDDSKRKIFATVLARYRSMFVETGRADETAVLDRIATEANAGERFDTDRLRASLAEGSTP